MVRACVHEICIILYTKNKTIRVVQDNDLHCVKEVLYPMNAFY